MSTATATTTPASAAPPSKPVCSQAEEVTDRLTSSLWKPLSLCCAYVYFLRQFYFTFRQCDGGQGETVFSDVWWTAPVCATLGYLGLIFGLKAYMADRKPMMLKDYMFTYNLYQTVLNIWCVFALIKEVYVQNMSVWGNRVDPSPAGFRLGFLIWVHYNNKYIELLDTVFMALRKKDKQISFLHMYHHVLLIWSWFAVCKYGCGGDAYFGALCNSFVHVLMYGYYLLALLKIKTPWKQWLTNIQMLQFCACFGNGVYCLRSGTYNIWLVCLQLWVMSNMLVLFGNFYRKTYVSAAKKKNAGKKEQ